MDLEELYGTEKVEAVRIKKLQERGGFGARILLVRTIESAELKQQTVDTYNESAAQFAEYFKAIGPREKHIKAALNLAGNTENPKVLELGCGDGRDAQVITKYADNYTGVDVSEGMIALARKNVPDANFIVSDAATYDFPENLDVVYAFASLLHLDRDEVKLVFEKTYNALKPGGIFYVSTKHKPEFTSEIKTDQFGKRLFYFYNEEVFNEIGGASFEVVASKIEAKQDTDWLEIAFRKK
jgi:SAM-dependent methyltransferase